MVNPYITATGPQPSQPDESISPLAALGFGSAAVFGSGFLPYKEGRLWDRYVAGIRSIETLSPAAVLRTFRTSEFLSPLESWADHSLSKEDIRLSRSYGEFLRKSFGSNISDLTMIRQGSDTFGEVLSGGKSVGMGISIKAGSQQGTALADYYARLTGTPLSLTQSLNEDYLRARHIKENVEVPFGEWVKALPPSARQQRLILGVKYRDEISFLGQKIILDEQQKRMVARAEITTQLLRARVAATTGRLNTLLSQPLEQPFIGPLLKKIPGIRNLAVEPGSAMQQVGRFTKKALMIGAAWKGLEYYDYLRSEGSPWAAALGPAAGGAIGAFAFKKMGQKFSPLGLGIGLGAGLYTAVSPRFESGLFHGALSLLTDLNVARAKVSDAIGLTESLQEQEAVTPGLISPLTALGFGGAGALIGGTLSYGDFLVNTVTQMHKDKGVLADVAEAVRDLGKANVGDKFWGSGVGEFIQKLPGGKLLSKARSPMKLGFLGGLAAWTALSTGSSLLSGNLGAAIPGLNLLGTPETAEDLQAIYSGEEEVPIRKGRFWEAGRCNCAESLIFLDIFNNKEAKDIAINDTLLGSDGKPYQINHIWKRKHKGTVLDIYTSLDRNVPTSLTPNHLVPVIKKYKKYISKISKIPKLIPAEKIKVGDFVNVPIPLLDESVSSIEAEEYLKTGLHLSDKNLIYSAQINWFTKKIQRSGGKPISKTIEFTPNLGRLFGYYLAEGNISFKGKEPQFIELAFSIHEKYLLNDISFICKEEFDLVPTIRHKKTGKKTKEGCYVIRICNSLLARIFFELFQKSDRDKDKTFPSLFFSASKEFKKELIRGYHSGDGHIDRGRLVISSARYDFVKAIRILLLSFGIAPTTPKCEILNYIKENGDNALKYRIGWTEDSEYQDVQGFFWIEGKLYASVSGILEKEYDDFVYDFEINHPDHLITNGTFLVHNSTKYSGGKIDYYRPHLMARLQSRAYQKGLYGDESEKWEHDPLLNPLDALFGSDEWKYHYEQKYQYERPAPLSSIYGEDIPFIGPVIAATFGKLLKPRKLIRPDEWVLGNGEFLHRPDIRGETEPAYELGGLGPGAPVAPEEGSQLFNKMMYKRREAVGLPGFVEGSIEKSFTGREEVFQNLQTMSTMGKETGSEYWLWKHLNLGGAAMASEPIRRFIPRTPSYLEEYNPLPNTALPSWVPSDYFMDLKTGNPFSKIPEAEIRLPGSPGFEALHPEIAGTNPEYYPLGYRVKVLGDIAQWSSAYQDTLRQAKNEFKFLSPIEQKMILETEEQVAEKKKRRDIVDYRFRPELLTEQTVNVTEVLDPRSVRTAETGNMVVELQGVGAVNNMVDAMEFAKNKLLGRELTLKVPAMESRRYDMTTNNSRMKAVVMFGGTDYGSLMAESNLTQPAELSGEFEQLRFGPMEQFAGGLSERILHSAETPLEYLTPLSPVAKLIRQRSALEEYKASEAYGTSNAFWDRPWENFIVPAANMAKASMGFGEISSEAQQRREIQEYFDMLKWVKARKLEDAARQQGDERWVTAQREIQQDTLFGLDVYGSPVDAIKALPRKERDFFVPFSEAATDEERNEILSLVPENERRLYQAQWMKQEAEKAEAKRQAGIADRHDEETLTLNNVMRKAEGFDITPDLEEQWLDQTGGEMPLDDWLREKKASEYFSTHSLPGAEWLGWSSATDMEDVKLKYVEMAGLSHYDFDLWNTRKSALARKPYINEELIAQMSQKAKYVETMNVRRNADWISRMHSDGDAKVTSYSVAANLKPSYDIEIIDKREDLKKKTYKQMGVRYQ